MDDMFMAKRYAMIRRAALKIQQRNRQQSQRRTQHLQEKKLNKAIEVLDDQSNMHWSDTDRYINAHYGDRLVGDSYE